MSRVRIMTFCTSTVDFMTDILTGIAIGLKNRSFLENVSMF